MTTTPTFWKSAFAVYQDSTALQLVPSVIGLSNGDLLVTWSEQEDFQDSSPEIFAQRFSAEGILQGLPQQLNSFVIGSGSSAGADPAYHTSAAMPDGGFVIAYQGAVADGTSAIIVERFDASGTQVFSASRPRGQLELLSDEVALNITDSGAYALTFYRLGGIAHDVRTIVFDGATNVAGPEFDSGDENANLNQSPQSSTLSSGNFVVVFWDESSNDVRFRISQFDGVPGAPAARVSNAGKDPDVAGLPGGGFVVAWDRSGDIFFRLGSNEGVLLPGIFVAADGGSKQEDSRVVALRDGGFFIAWEDATAGQILGQRYSALAGEVGSPIVVASHGRWGTNQGNNLALSSDGRILVTYNDEALSAGEVRQVILDPRDNKISATNKSETYTTQVGDTQLSGNGGDDLLLGQGGNDMIHGDSGRDNVRGGLGNDTLFGDAGADRLEGGLGADSLDGGDGSDAAVYVNAKSAVIVNLTTGLGALNQAEGDTFIGIENIEGSEFGDTLTGNGENNELFGRGGADQLHGGPGADFIDGGNGDDLIVIGNNASSDRIKGGRGIDTLDLHAIEFRNITVNLREGFLSFHAGFSEFATLSSIEIVIATDGDDTLDGSDRPEALFGGLGDDEFVGFGGADKFDGGPGLDSVDYVEAAAGVEIDLAAGLGKNDEAEGDTFTGIETVSGSEHDDVLTGNGLRNILFGRNGDDTLKGGNGADLVQGWTGDDSLTGGSGNDTLIGGGGLDQLKGGGGMDTFVFHDISSSLPGPQSDRIADFVQGTDKIDVSRILLSFPSLPFTFIGDGKFSGTAGEWRFEPGGSATRVQADMTGDGVADFQIKLAGVGAVAESDFVL